LSDVRKARGERGSGDFGNTLSGTRRITPEVVDAGNDKLIASL
jgi:hypothetical protein